MFRPPAGTILLGMQSKVHPTYKTDRLMAMTCLALQRHGRVRWLFSHHPHTVLALVLVFAVGVFAPGVASAQDATIAGTVTDATGGILPGVAVEARDAAGTAQVTVTDGTGQFTVSGLTPGTYAVTFTLPGFTVPAQVVEASAGATAVPGRGNGGRRACRAGGGGRDPRPAAVGDRLAGPD